MLQDTQPKLTHIIADGNAVIRIIQQRCAHHLLDRIKTPHCLRIERAEFLTQHGGEFSMECRRRRACICNTDESLAVFVALQHQQSGPAAAA